MSDDKPTPRPTIPSPAALARMHPRPVAAPPAVAHSESARFGRVDDEGHVFVTVGDEEREVGSYPGATPDEALQYFARKYDELAASADLLEARLANPDVSAKEVADGLTTLKEHVETTGVVGDIPALQATVERVEAGLEAKRAHEAEHRAAARAEATVAARGHRRRGRADRRPAGRLHAVEDQRRADARPARPVEAAPALRRQARQGHRVGPVAALQPRPQLLRQGAAGPGSPTSRPAAPRPAPPRRSSSPRPRQLATSTDWTPTARAFKQLMDRWRAAGRASRAEDDALWERFRTAQDAFFAAKDEISAAEDEEFRANLAVKEELLTEADALLPDHRRRGREVGPARHPGPVGEGRQGAARRPRAGREADAAGRDRRARGRRAALDPHQPRGRGPGPLPRRPARGVRRRRSRPTSPRPRPRATPRRPRPPAGG